MLLAAIVSVSGVANAQTTGRAGRLFDAGVADLKRGNYAQACAALEESYGLDDNIGTLMALGDCLDRWGKLHSAARRFEELIAVVSSAGAAASDYRSRQLDYARSALARLTPEIPELRLIYSTPVDPGARVLLDGHELEPAPPEQDVRVDPGHHLLEAQGLGRDPWRLELELRPGEHRSVPLELGQASAPEPPPPEPPPPTAPPVSEPSRAAAAVELPEPETNPWRTVAWVLGGVGVAGVGVGAVAAVKMLQACPSYHCDSSDRDGRQLALVSDIGFGVGLAALAGSVVLLLKTDPTAPRTVGTAAWRPLGGFDARGGWLALSHTF